MFYFLYKFQNIANIGGVFPKTKDGEIELGLGVQDGYYLGKMISHESLNSIKNYFVCFIDDDTADGFKLVGITQIPIDPMNPHTEYRDLTTTELTKQALADKLLLKLKLRSHISLEVGDTDDLIADMSKRTDLIERLLLRVFYYTLQDIPIPQAIKDAYLPMVTNYINSVDNQTLRVRADLEDPQEVFNKLAIRTTKIADIVKEEYFDKL